MRKILSKIIAFIILFTLIFSFKVEAKNAENYRLDSLNVFGLEMIFKDREFFSAENTKVTLEEKENNNKAVAIFGGCLAIYWIVLLFIFEKEESYNYAGPNSDDMEILKKYNPMVAGCLVDNRQVVSRDVIAVILNLINKKVINMQMVPNFDNKNDEIYKYIISENREHGCKLDEIERYVLNWLFGFYEKDKIELSQKLKEISKNKEFIKHLKNLNQMTQKKLNSIGANVNKVPLLLRMSNVFVLIFSIILVAVHIASNGLNIHIYETTVIMILAILFGILLILPVIALLMHVVLVISVLIKRAIKNEMIEKSGKEIVTTSVIILLTTLLFALVAYLVLPDKYLCLDIFMIGMCILIVKTDNLMTKHSKEIMQDYYELEFVRNKIEEYSLIEEKHINYMKLWEEYLIYAVAFGIPLQIVDKLKHPQKEDQDIEYLLKCEGLYYISKAYLEIMWEMEFKEPKRKYNMVKELFSLTE